MAFTKRATAPVSKPSSKLAAAIASAPLEFVSSGSGQPAPGQQRTSKTADILNPLFCAACNKVFAKETVFHEHKKGKKHINELKAMGLFEEAEAELAKARPSAQSGGAAKREAEGCDGERTAKRLAHAPLKPAEADAPIAPATAVYLPPVEHEWWKGTVHAKPAQERADAADAAESTGDWLCVSQRCTGVRNARNAPHCKACGALRRLGTQTVRADQRDSVNDYARRT
jgi:hypothetical protein